MKLLKELFSEHIVTSNLLSSVKITELHLSSGRIIASDALLYDQTSPFLTKVPAGDYELWLHYSKKTAYIAYAELRIKSSDVKTWMLALKKGQKVEHLKEGQIYGFSVDSGYACFMDLDTVSVLEQHVEQLEEENEDYDNYYDDYLDEVLDGAYFINKPFEHLKHNIPMFMAGYGDGFYATYIGLNEEEEPAKFVIDFGVDLEE